jgi:hypothetical protein
VCVHVLACVFICISGCIRAGVHSGSLTTGPDLPDIPIGPGEPLIVSCGLEDDSS